MTLTIDDLAAGYGRRTVLSGVTIPTIAGGAFVGLIGPNASGKSTLFRTIAGLLCPRAGAIRLDGEELQPCRAGCVRGRLPTCRRHSAATRC